MPRISREQSKHGRPVTLGEIRRGDLLFYKTHKRRHRKGLQKIGHVAAYLGNNHMIHATEEGGIGIINIHQYPKGVLAKARRVILD